MKFQIRFEPDYEESMGLICPWVLTYPDGRRCRLMDFQFCLEEFKALAYVISQGGRP